jgi:ATP-binding cassette subfamily B protein
VGAIAFLALVSLTMTAGLAVIAAILMLVLFRLAAAGAPLHHGFADKAALVEGELVDVVVNLPLVRTFAGIGREHVRFDETVGREMTARRASLLYLEKLRLLHAGVTIVLTVALLAWAIVLWQRGEASGGDVILVCTLGFTILHSTRDLAVALVEVTQHMARLSEAISTLLQPHALKDHPEAEPLAGSRYGVAFENVSFAYPDGSPVLKHFSLRFGAGQRTGLVGPSGAGKSTLLGLIQRSHNIDQGRILIDGQDVSRITQESIREAISFVSQDIAMLHRSVLENIRYGKPDASDAEVAKAVEAARCRDFIEAMPQGFATIVGDHGARLSGGQRQRIAIARALLKDSPILLLDEATSSLDSESEEEIRKALDRLMDGRTVIAIAHRLSTLRSFDRIVVLHQGRVAQDGSPDELLRRDGPYRRLVEHEMARLAQAA